MKEEKKIYLEILRIIAFVCVMFNHTGTYGFELFTQDRPMALRMLGIAKPTSIITGQANTDDLELNGNTLTTGLGREC